MAIINDIINDINTESCEQSLDNELKCHSCSCERLKSRENSSDYE